ncbi:type III secretion system chaperone [Variovorax paradoxus]|nr:type III secretion system chaperone [Variovorax paradoxus]
MHTLEATRQLIMEMAPNAIEIEEIQESGGGTWGFGFSDESVMTAEWAEMPDRLVLTFFLGEPPEEYRLAACELLLSFNQMSAETGGVRGGMASDGNFALIYDVPAAPLTEVEFREIVMNLAALGRKWGQTIRGELDESTSDASAQNQLM